MLTCALTQTDKFYDALRMFGTDFTLIASKFPNRTRKQIKAKFVREESANSAAVTWAVKNPFPLPDDCDPFILPLPCQLRGFPVAELERYWALLLRELKREERRKAKQRSEFDVRGCRHKLSGGKRLLRWLGAGVDERAASSAAALETGKGGNGAGANGHADDDEAQQSDGGDGDAAPGASDDGDFMGDDDSDDSDAGRKHRSARATRATRSRSARKRGRGDD